MQRHRGSQMPSIPVTYGELDYLAIHNDTVYCGPWDGMAQTTSYRVGSIHPPAFGVVVPLVPAPPPTLPKVVDKGCEGWAYVGIPGSVGNVPHGVAAAPTDVLTGACPDAVGAAACAHGRYHCCWGSCC